MKLLLLSDVHLLDKTPVARKDDLVEKQFDKLDYILSYAAREDAAVLQAGDFFDRPRSWDLLPKVLQILKIHKVPMFCVFGQHDTYLYSRSTRDSTSLGVLAKAGTVKILDGNPTRLNEGIRLYGCSYGGEVPKPKSKSKFNILVIHAPISDASLFEGFPYTRAENFLKRNQSYNLVLCGDIHKEFLVSSGSRVILNAGPLLRKEATEYNLSFKPKLWLADVADNKCSIKKEDIPIIDPGTSVLSRDHIDTKEQTSMLLDQFVEGLKSKVKMGFNFHQNLLEYISKNKIEEPVRNILSNLVHEEDKGS